MLQSGNPLIAQCDMQIAQIPRPRGTYILCVCAIHLHVFVWEIFELAHTILHVVC